MGKRNIRTAKGFTLIELVIVIAVIAILAALLAPTILGQAERARLSRTRDDVNNLAKAAARMRQDTGAMGTYLAFITFQNMTTAAQGDVVGTLPYNVAQYYAQNPTTSHCTVSSDPGRPCWGGPYIQLQLVGSGAAASPMDPWNDPYTLIVDTVNTSFTVCGGGPDGTLSKGCYSTMVSGDGDDVTALQ